MQRGIPRADELAAAAEVESLAAAAIIVQQIDEITVKSQQADVVVEANNSKNAITTLNEDLQALLFDDDATTSDVNQNAILITNNSELAISAMNEDTVTITISLHEGNASAIAWGCDLTEEYVKINSEMTT